MSELQTTNKMIEYGPDELSVRQQLESLANSEVLLNELEKSKQQMATDSELLALAATEHEIKVLRSRIYQEDSDVVIEQLIRQKRPLESDFYSNVRYGEYAWLKEQIYSIEHLRALRIDADSPEAKLLLATLSSEAGPSQSETAPFMNYHDNTSDAWQYVPDAAVKDYLEERLYVDTSRMMLDGNRVGIRGNSKNKLFNVPASLFVSAAGFESWKGRRQGVGKAWSSKYGHNETTSLNVMKHYASLETELPAVELVNVYVQPDGRMFADNDAGDSHRIGAAFLRGDTAVKAESINFVMLDHNILTD